jgi:hypothetical protein
MSSVNLLHSANSGLLLFIERFEGKLSLLSGMQIKLESRDLKTFKLEGLGAAGSGLLLMMSLIFLSEFRGLGSKLTD